MADLDFTTSLNDRGFTVGMKNIEKQAAKSAKAVEGLFKMEVMAKLGGGAARLLRSAFEAFAKDSADGAAALRELDGMVHSMMSSLGAELLPLLQQSLSLLKGIGDTVGKAWRSAIDSVAVGMRMLGGEEYQEALENVQSLRDSAGVNAELDRRIAAMKAAKGATGGAGVAGAVGKGDAASILREANRDIEDTLETELQYLVQIGRVEEERVKRHGELDGQMRGLSAAAREAAGEAEARLAIDEAAAALSTQIADAEATRRVNQRKVLAEQQQTRDLAWEGVQLETERLRIDNLRLGGLEKEADAARRRMEWAERTAEIDRNTLLTDEQRARVRRDMADLAAEEQRLLDEASDREYRRRMGEQGRHGGIGGEVTGTRGILGQVFGPAQTRADVGPAASAAAATATNTKDLVVLMKKAVDRGEFGTRGAVFA